MYKNKMITPFGVVPPIVISENTPWMFRNKAGIEEFRRHLKERQVYIQNKFNKGEVPQRSIDGANLSIEEYEQKLVEKRFIDKKGGEIKNPIVIKIPKFVKSVYALTFGIEDFESCGAIPCTFTSNGSYGTGQVALDATSKVNGTDSLRCDIAAADDGCVLRKTLTSASSYYVQFYFFVPTGWTFGVNGYLSLWSTEDADSAPIYCNIEDYGVVEIICDGSEMAYTDTGLSIALNTKTRLEFKTVISATLGDVDVWLNDTDATPTFNGAGNYNTGTQNITSFFLGGYHPDIVADKFYDDACVDTAFMGTACAVASAATSTRESIIWFSE